jgi:DNA-binding transcriptional MerR regulator
MSSIRPDGCIETAAICRVVGVAQSTLDYWVRTGLVTPTVRSSSGRRVSRLWTVEDAVLARAIKALRDAGCSVALLKRAKDVLAEEWRPLLGADHLYWDGHDLFKVGDWSEIESVVRSPGQAAFHLVVLPVDAWAQELLAEVRPLPDSVLLRAAS